MYCAVIDQRSTWSTLYVEESWECDQYGWHFRSQYGFWGKTNFKKKLQKGAEVKSARKPSTLVFSRPKILNLWNFPGVSMGFSHFPWIFPWKIHPFFAWGEVIGTLAAQSGMPQETCWKVMWPGKLKQKAIENGHRIHRNSWFTH